MNFNSFLLPSGVITVLDSFRFPLHPLPSLLCGLEADLSGLH